MSSFKREPGTGNLFKNDKGGNEKRPDHTGDIKDLNGNDWRIAAWWARNKDNSLKKDKDGNPYLFLKISAFEKREKKDDWPGPGGGGELDDDIGDIPF